MTATGKPKPVSSINTAYVAHQMDTIRESTIHYIVVTSACSTNKAVSPGYLSYTQICYIVSAWIVASKPALCLKKKLRFFFFF